MVLDEEQLQFDFEFGCPHIEAEYYRDGAQDLIRRLVPADLLEEKGVRLHNERARFADMLPLVVWSDLTKAPCALSVFLLCRYRLNACNFFYDMISRWLLPQKRVNVELFFASDVRLPHLSDDLLSVAEIVVHLKSTQDVEEVRRSFHSIETEIRLGVVSNYHARRILEFKGLSSDGKTAMIQEKIGSLIQSHSKDFDQGIFAQMQQFLVNCPEEFKSGRDYHHISRIISNLHSLRKLLKQNIDVFSTKRHIHLKFLKTQVNGSKSVLGVIAGLNFLHDHEVFEASHLVSAIQKHFPKARLVEGSFFTDRNSESSIQTQYLEIEKEQGADFTLEEIQLLRIALPDQIKGHIEQLTHAIFMPRNEEEVLRNIMSLSRQLRFVNDMPQVIITFDEQKGGNLHFTIILLRVKLENAATLQEIFAASKTVLPFVPDRVRQVGQLRKKYVKEATVFRTHIASAAFLRPDHSVDLYKAREIILRELSRLIGEVRDYNGGMIYKQTELLSRLKLSLGRVGEQNNILLEKFFFSLNPIEMRTALDVEPLKQFYLLLIQVMKTDFHLRRKVGDFLIKEEAARTFAVVPMDAERKSSVEEKIARLALLPHQMVTFFLESGDGLFGGYLLLSEVQDLKERFLRALE